MCPTPGPARRPIESSNRWSQTDTEGLLAVDASNFKGESHIYSSNPTRCRPDRPSPQAYQLSDSGVSGANFSKAIGGLATFIFILVFRTPSRPTSDLNFRHKIAKMDLPGASISIAAIVCLLLALQWGGTKYPWSHSTVWGCLLGFGLLLLVFLAWQLRLGDEYDL